MMCLLWGSSVGMVWELWFMVERECLAMLVYRKPRCLVVEP
jgi:hypothetical protein